MEKDPKKEYEKVKVNIIKRLAFTLYSYAFEWIVNSQLIFIHFPKQPKQENPLRNLRCLANSSAFNPFQAVQPPRQPNSEDCPALRFWSSLSQGEAVKERVALRWRHQRDKDLKKNGERLCFMDSLIKIPRMCKKNTKMGACSWSLNIIQHPSFVARGPSKSNRKRWQMCHQAAHELKEFNKV